MARHTDLRDVARQERMERIRSAAAALFRETDFDAVTTRDVARRAQVADATFFRYVRSKHDLLALVYGDRLDVLLNEVEEEDARTIAQARASVPADELVVRRVHHVYRRRCEFYRLAPSNVARYLRQGFDTDPVLSARPVAQGDRTIRLVTSVLRDGQVAGVVDAGVAADLVAQNLHGTYMHEIDRTPVRGFDPGTIWDRLRPRLDVQLDPLLGGARPAGPTPGS